MKEKESLAPKTMNLETLRQMLRHGPSVKPEIRKDEPFEKYHARLMVHNSDKEILRMFKNMRGQSAFRNHRIGPGNHYDVAEYEVEKNGKTISKTIFRKGTIPSNATKVRFRLKAGSAKAGVPSTYSDWIEVTKPEAILK